MDDWTLKHLLGVHESWIHRNRMRFYEEAQVECYLCGERVGEDMLKDGYWICRACFTADDPGTIYGYHQNRSAIADF